MEGICERSMITPGDTHTAARVYWREVNFERPLAVITFKRELLNAVKPG